MLGMLEIILFVPFEKRKSERGFNCLQYSATVFKHLKCAGRPANRLSTKKHNTYQLLYIHSLPPDDGLQICSKHVVVD